MRVKTVPRPEGGSNLTLKANKRSTQEITDQRLKSSSHPSKFQLASILPSTLCATVSIANQSVQDAAKLLVPLRAAVISTVTRR